MRNRCQGGKETQPWSEIRAYLLCDTPDDPRACGEPAVDVWSFTDEKGKTYTYWLCAGHWDLHCRIVQLCQEQERESLLDATE